MARVLDKLTLYTGTIWDAVWHFVLDIDPNEQEELHERMIVQFARYARQDIETVEQMELSTLQRYYRRLVEVVKQENAYTRANEEG